MAKKLPPGKKKLIPLLCAAVLIPAVLAAWALAPRFPRLEAAGFRITEEEYLRAMYQARNDVLSDHAAAGIPLRDWDCETALGYPRELTMNRTLEILREFYAVGTLAVERGYLSDAGYGAMLESMEEINRKRQEALDAGAAVTGLPNFTLNDYIAYRASSIRLQFCNDSDNPEYSVTPEELRRRYEADRDNLYRQPDALELAFLVLRPTPEEAPALRSQLQALQNLALEQGGLAAALEEMPQLREYYQEISVDPATYGTYARSHGDILACSEGLHTGELSEIIDLDDWLCLVECRRRTEHDYVPLEDVQSIVEQSVRESRYEALIAELMENTQIQGNLQALYRFTAEQLP